MEEKKEFGYVAKLPSEEGKAKKFGGGQSEQPPQKKIFVTTKEFEDPKEKEMIKSVLKRVQLSSAAWQSLKEDLDNRQSKNYISRRFGIKPDDLKWLRKYLGYV